MVLRLSPVVLLACACALPCACGGRSDLPLGRGHGPKLAAANADTCLLDSQGAVACWGLSFGNVPRLIVDGPARELAVLAGTVASAAASSLVCIIDSDARVRCIDAIGAVLEPGIEDATRLCAGPAHGCAVTIDGAVQCWGDNAVGQLGDGTLTSRDFAAPVLGSADFLDVACGEFATCALRADGSASCWGADLDGALGDGPADHPVCGGFPCSAEPVAIASAADEIAAGLHGGCLRVGGEVRCWGWNGSGEVGDGTQTPRDAPTPVIGLHDAASIYAGYLRKCAVGDEGSLVCWGSPPAVGSSLPASATPVAVGSLPAVVDVAGGWYHLCALGRDAQAYCWGDNEWGQLGDGTLVSRDLPAPIAD